MKRTTSLKGCKIDFDDDLVEVYDEKGNMVYSGIQDDNPYKYDNFSWNAKDENTICRTDIRWFV